MSRPKKAPSSPVVSETAPSEGPGKGPENRRKAGQFKPGQSGNPGGRHKLAEGLRVRCRRAVDERVIEAWVAEVEAQGKDWVRCSELLAAYGYGKPSSAPEDLDAVREGGGAGLAVLTRDDLLAIARGEKP